MLPDKTIHIVDNEILCDRQYANYREKQGQEQGFNQAVQTIRGINQKAGDDKAFRLMVLARFLPAL